MSHHQLATLMFLKALYKLAFYLILTLNLFTLCVCVVFDWASKKIVTPRVPHNQVGPYD